jgi:hypothetical protein
MFLALAGCGSTPANQDMSVDLSVAMDLTGTTCNNDLNAPVSACGKPCDTGNSLGVGLFCKDAATCAGNSMAKICSSLVNPGNADDTYFCTFVCDPLAASPCGENATCNCRPGIGCGCTHNRCPVPNG